MVTTRTTAGVSALLADDLTEELVQIKALPTIRFTDLWSVDRAPADNALVWDADPAVEVPSPSSGGHILRLLEIEPDPPGYDPASGFHTTNTIDHLVVLSGEVVCLLDSEEVILGPGDVLVQRGTRLVEPREGALSDACGLDRCAALSDLRRELADVRVRFHEAPGRRARSA